MARIFGIEHRDHDKIYRGIRRWVEVVFYRLGQVRQQLGFVDALSAEERAEVERWLPTSALPLFETMSKADQRHSLRVCQRLLASGCAEKELLAAALLHDVGKGGGRVPFWVRPVLVIGKICAPSLLARLLVSPSVLHEQKVARWRRALSYGWWHANVGAELAASAGLSELAVLYIRTHELPDGPAAALYTVDEVS